MTTKAHRLRQIIATTDPQQALSVQRELAPLVCIPQWPCLARSSDKLRILALDVAYSDSLIVGSAVLWDPQRHEASWQSMRSSTTPAFPYVPGLLAFREIPTLYPLIDEALAHAFPTGRDEAGDNPSIVLLCDGLGIAHPQGLGLASHLGLIYDLPSIGTAKNHFWGTYDAASLGFLRGSRVLLRKPSDESRQAEQQVGPEQEQEQETVTAQPDEAMGHVLRTQDGVNPIFVSPGHRVSLDEAADVVLSLCSTYRLPDPIRSADHIGRIELQRLERERAQPCKQSDR